MEKEIRQHFGKKVFSTVIPRNVRIAEAPSHGVPGVLFDVASAGAKAYIALGKEVLSNEKEL